MSTYEETVWLILPGRGAPARRADKKHHELKSFGRFWYQEIRDFINSKRTVVPPLTETKTKIKFLKKLLYGALYPSIRKSRISWY